MPNERRCSRTGCIELAVATLTYVYRDSTAVVGPLATVSEPHSYDLCSAHAGKLTAPLGWEVVRADGEFPPPPDDLTVLAEAVREAAGVDGADGEDRADSLAGPAAAPGAVHSGSGPGRRGHLRVLPRRTED